MTKIVLASQSPRRKQILQCAQVDFEVLTRATPETYPPGMDPSSVAVHIARQKAEAVRDLARDHIIIAADTIVVMGDEIIGKPQNKDHAIEILQKLGGKTHGVITGVVLENKDKVIAFAERTEVEFYDLSMQEIHYYIDNFQPYDKAGAYAIQEWIGVRSIKAIEGDFYNVMGLPISKVLRALRAFEPSFGHNL
ncbi:MAG: Maf-like protein [Flavisolibacter sp.]